jgi:aldose 1-epimerase
MKSSSGIITPGSWRQRHCFRWKGLVAGSCLLLAALVTRAAGEDGVGAGQFELKNSQGMTVRLAAYGARVTSIVVPDRDGNFADVVLGYHDVDSYKTAPKKPYLGATLGRYAGRIAGGRFTLEGKAYRLPCNSGPNHNHGGVVGFDKVTWEAQRTPDGVRFSYRSQDGEEGYPGNVAVAVTFTLTDNNSLIIDYRATTDQATPVNLSNHSYFNLSGEGAETVLDHLLMVQADAMLPIDATSVPTGQIAPVKGTPFDFRTYRRIGDRIDDEDQQLVFGKGYDHTFVLNPAQDGQPTLAASLYDPGSGRLLEVFTQEPGLQVYTANFLDGILVGKAGRPYLKRSAVCLEAQHFPDSPNKDRFPNTILRPGELYQTRTLYHFSTRQLAPARPIP